MSGARRSRRDGGPAPADVEFAAALLPLWGFPPGTGITPAGEQGTNNRTFLVRHGQQRYVLRVSGFLSVAAVRAELGILQRLRQGALPFLVPQPVAARRADSGRDHGRARRRLPVAARGAPRHGR